MIKWAGRDLSIPPLPAAPGAIAYDAVSARFVLSARTTDALSVLSETSTNVTALTSRGWSGRDITSAIAIDRAEGDLYVAVHDASGASLHRLQLISGRRLEVIEPPEGSAAELTAIAVTSEGVLALDRAGRRVLRRVPQQDRLSVYLTVPETVTPSALAHSSRSLYVAHDEGVIRVDLASKQQQPLAAAENVALGGLQSLVWHGGRLFGIRRAADRRDVVRVRLNAAGTAAIGLDVLAPAASDAATASGGVFYYIAAAENGTGTVVKGINLAEMN
jgi:hypothetical protein